MRPGEEAPSGVRLRSVGAGGVAVEPQPLVERGELRVPGEGRVVAVADADDSLVGILDEYGLQDVPIWITEFGAPTGGLGQASDGSLRRNGTEVDHVTERRQAQIAFDSVVTSVVTPRVKMLVWYTDIDLPGEAYGKQAYYGLFRADGTPKPAWRQLKRAVNRFAG